MVDNNAATNGQIVSLYTHFTGRMEEQEKLFTKDMAAVKETTAIQLVAIQRAVDLAYASMNERLASMNEFRSALKDQAGLMATKLDVKALDEKTEVELRALREFRTAMQSAASQDQVNTVAKTADFGRTLAIIGTAVSVISLIISVVVRLAGG